MFNRDDVLLVSIDETHIRSDRNGQPYQWQFVSNDRPFKFAMRHNPEMDFKDADEGAEAQSLGEITSEMSEYSHRSQSQKSRIGTQGGRPRGRPKKTQPPPEATVKRKRGRPRKHLSHSLSGDSSLG